MKDLLKNKFIVLLLLLVFLLGVFYVINLITAPPQITNTEPKNGSGNIPVSQKISLNFNKPVSKNSFEMVVNPLFDYQIKTEGNTMRILPATSLKNSTNYQIVLKERFFKKTVLDLRFTTVLAQGSPETVAEGETLTKNYYPLAPLSPPDNSRFYFKYVDRLTLNVYLLGDKKTSQKEFEDWAKEKGVSLSTHQIQYLSPP